MFLSQIWVPVTILSGSITGGGWRDCQCAGVGGHPMDTPGEVMYDPANG